MATTKVSELAELTSPDGAEQLLVNDGGTSKRLLVSNLPVGSLGANSVDSDQYVDGSIDTVHIGDDQVTYAKIQNVSATDRILGRDSSGAGVIEEITPANLRTMINVEDGATADQSNAEIAAAVEAASDSNTFTDADHTKLNAIEASADVTDATNVTAAGALMDSEVTNLAQVKAFDASDYATAAQGTTADAALPKAGGTMTGDLNFGDDVDANFGGSSDLKIYHDGSNSYIKEQGTGNLDITSNGTNISIMGKAGENSIIATGDGSVELYHDNSKKFETTANGVTVTGTAIATTDTDTSNSGTVDLDFAAKQNFVLTLTGNITSLTASNEQVGQSGFIVFIQDGTGGRTVSLHGDYETAAGAGLTLTSTASATDIVPYVVAASSRILLGTPQLAFS